MSEMAAAEEPGPDCATAEDVGKEVQEGAPLDIGDPECMTLEQDTQAAFDAMWAEAQMP